LTSVFIKILRPKEALFSRRSTVPLNKKGYGQANKKIPCSFSTKIFN
jgi:hypothetical protein